VDWKRRTFRAVAEVLISHPLPGSSKLLRNAHRMLGRPPSGPMVVPTRYGFSMQVDPARNGVLDACIHFNGTYEAGSVHVIQETLRPGDVFVDVGANIGLMTFAASWSVGPRGEVHSFEPMPETFANLRANIELNHAVNVHPHEVALGSEEERRTIYERAWINKGGAASLVRPERSSAVTHDIRVVRLDTYLPQETLRRVRMIKVDIEGWELEMLRGAETLLARESAPALCIEYSVENPAEHTGSSDLYDFLNSVNSYRFFKLRHGKETISRLVPIDQPADLPTHDNIFCFLPEHVSEIGAPLFHLR
jgi:FkbM family methyltransferase